MKWHALFVACALAAQGSAAVLGSGQSANALPVPIEERSVELAIRNEPAVTSTALEPRRISVAMYTSTLQTLTAFTGGACTALYAAPNALTGTACAASAIATLGYIIWNHWRGVDAKKMRRQDFHTIAGPPSQTLEFMFDMHGNSSATAAMAHVLASVPDREILVASHRCQGVGCYDYFYTNIDHPSLGRVSHKVMQRPKPEWLKALKKRQTDEQAFEDSYDENDGTPVYGTYEYWDSSTSDENYIGNNESSDDFSESLYDAASQQDVFKNQGYYCVNIIDSQRGGAVDSTGYFDVSAGHNMDDPDNEQSYLEQCYDEEFGRKRNLDALRVPTSFTA